MRSCPCAGRFVALLVSLSLLFPVEARAQSPARAGANFALPHTSIPAPLPSAPLPAEASSSAIESSAVDLNFAPDPLLPEKEDRSGVPYAADETFGFLSRVGVGADVGPLGIGIKGAVVLTPAIDGRMDVNYFSYRSGSDACLTVPAKRSACGFDIDGWNVAANLHMDSAAMKVDFYPFNSVWRITPGLMFVNGTQFSGKGYIAGGSSFSLNGTTYYSARENSATGRTPLNGTGKLGFHRRVPAFTATFGFGRFIPRSHRHWSFPSEFGVAFTGAPTVDVKLAGWACTDYAETQCGDVSSPASPVGAEFNRSLNTAVARWRHDLSSVQVYPIFTYGVVYSFTLPR